MIEDRNMKNRFIKYIVFSMIGVMITLPLFSHDIKAESYTGSYDAVEVVDEIIDYDSTRKRYYTHWEVTINTNTDYSYGSIYISEIGSTFYYSGRSTYQETPRYTYIINNSEVIPQRHYSGTFTPNVVLPEYLDVFKTISAHFKGYTTDFNTYTSPSGTVTLGTEYYYVYDNISWIEDKGMVVYRITLPIGGYVKSIDDFHLYIRYNSDPYDMHEVPIYTIFDSLSRSYFNIYFTIQNEYRYGTGFDLVVKTDKNSRYYPTHFNGKISYLLPTDTYYNELTYYINAYEYFNRDSETSTEVDDTNTTFEEKSQQMIDMEINYKIILIHL